MSRHQNNPRLNRSRRRDEQRVLAEKLGVNVDADQDPVAAILKVSGLPADTLIDEESGVAELFARTIQNVREGLKPVMDDSGKLIQVAHNAAVDIKVEFKSVDMKRKGLIFKSKQKQSTIAVHLATRILPEE